MAIEPTSAAPILSIRDLRVEFDAAGRILRAVDGVSLDLHEGETLGVVGETGSGKSVTMLAALGLLSAKNVRRISGEVIFGGRDLLKLGRDARRAILGKEIGMIFQDPLAALNPVMRVGDQIAESIVTHDPAVAPADARSRSIELLELVGVPQPDLRRSQYPHEFSGGMRQRVLIAMAIANSPRVLVADEPTTALDVTIQAQLLDLLRAIQRRTGTAIIFISHNVGVIAEMCDRTCVMYAGRAVEIGRTEDVLFQPSHPYTAGLLSCLPSVQAEGRLWSIEGQLPDLSLPRAGCSFASRCNLAIEVCRREEPALDVVGMEHRSACHRTGETALAVRAASGVPSIGCTPAAQSGEPVVRVEALVKHFPVRSGVFGRRVGTIHSVDGVSFFIADGETLGLVGETGCGKSTVAKTLSRLEEPTAGRVRFRGRDLGTLSAPELRMTRKEMQIVFQDPFSSLNPMLSVGGNIAEPMRIHGFGVAERRRRVIELLLQVGLRPEHAMRLPSQLSGGQRQRVGIARALALRPRFVILDEPVSSLDVSVQAKVLNLLKDLQANLGLSYLFISHDLSVIKYMSDRVAVMYLGRIVETGTADDVFSNPLHPYTQCLLSAIPALDRATRGARIRLEGDLPSPVNLPTGCRFRTRCWKAQPRCARDEPPLAPADGRARLVACHFAGPLDQTSSAAGQATAAA